MLAEGFLNHPAYDVEGSCAGLWQYEIGST